MLLEFLTKFGNEFNARLLEIIQYLNASLYTLNDLGMEIAKFLTKALRIFQKIDKKLEEAPNWYVFEFQDGKFIVEEIKPEQDDPAEEVINLSELAKFINRN